MAEYCLECGDKIIGRADKKFCNDSCRNAYYNRQNRESANFYKRINKKLRDNYQILSELNFKDGKSKVLKSSLLKEGFDFEFFTNMKVYKNGAEYRFLYNIGYRFLEDDWILVVKNDEGKQEE